MGPGRAVAPEDRVRALGLTLAGLGTGCYGPLACAPVGGASGCGAGLTAGGLLAVDGLLGGPDGCGMGWLRGGSAAVGRCWAGLAAGGLLAVDGYWAGLAAAGPGGPWGRQWPWGSGGLPLAWLPWPRQSHPAGQVGVEGG